MGFNWKMSASQLELLLTAIRSNSALRSELSAASNLFHAAEISQAAGYDVTWQDWMRYQARMALMLSEEDMLEYCRRLSDGREVFAHATFIPVFGHLCKKGAFQWVVPFEGD